MLKIFQYFDFIYTELLRNLFRYIGMKCLLCFKRDKPRATWRTLTSLKEEKLRCRNGTDAEWSCVCRRGCGHVGLPFPVLRDFSSSEQPVMWLPGTSRSDFWGHSHHHLECGPQGVSCFLSSKFLCLVFRVGKADDLFSLD